MGTNNPSYTAVMKRGV